MLSVDPNQIVTRAYASFTIPGARLPYQAIIDTGSEANVLGLNFVTESNLARYLRPYYAELFPLGDKLIPCSFKLMLPINFLGNSETHMVDFIVLNNSEHIILGQPWLRSMELCLDLGYTTPGVNVVKTSPNSKLGKFSTPLRLETIQSNDVSRMSRTFTRFSVPFMQVGIPGTQSSHSVLVDTGAMVNIISLKKFKQISSLMDLQMDHSEHKSLTGAGSSIPVLGKINLNLSIHLHPRPSSKTRGLQPYTMEISDSFLVAEDPGEDLTLGFGFFERQPWLLDFPGAAIYCNRDYFLPISYPRDYNVPTSVTHRETSPIKTYLASLYQSSHLAQVTGLEQFAHECLAVYNFYTENDTRPCPPLDYTVLLIKPQHGADGYAARVANR